MKTFIAPNGREVSETVTDSGVTAVIDTSIPEAALKGWREHLLRRMARNVYSQNSGGIDEIKGLSED